MLLVKHNEKTLIFNLISPFIVDLCEKVVVISKT